MSNPYLPANLDQKRASHATRIRRRNLNPKMGWEISTWKTHVCEDWRLIWKLPDFIFLGSTFIKDIILKKYTHNIHKTYKPYFLICLFYIHLSTTVVIWLGARSDKRYEMLGQVEERDIVTNSIVFWRNSVLYSIPTILCVSQIKLFVQNNINFKHFKSITEWPIAAVFCGQTNIYKLTLLQISRRHV
jgi:hypothetical protein